MILLHHEAQTMLPTPSFPILYSSLSSQTLLKAMQWKHKGGRQVKWVGLNSVQEVVTGDRAWDLPDWARSVPNLLCKAVNFDSWNGAREEAKAIDSSLISPRNSLRALKLLNPSVQFF